MSVKCVIYRCAKKQEMYLYIPFEDDEQEMLARLPAGLVNLTGKLDKVMELELTPERKLARALAQDVIAALQTQGYYLQMPPNEVLKHDASMLRDDSDSF